MAKTLDEQVEAFRTRTLDAGPYAFVWLDALTQKAREGGRIINVHVLVATGVNDDGRDGHIRLLHCCPAVEPPSQGWRPGCGRHQNRMSTGYS